MELEKYFVIFHSPLKQKKKNVSISWNLVNAVGNFSHSLIWKPHKPIEFVSFLCCGCQIDVFFFFREQTQPDQNEEKKCIIRIGFHRIHIIIENRHIENC